MTEPPAGRVFPALSELTRLLCHLPDQPTLRAAVLEGLEGYREALSSDSAETMPGNTDQTWGAEREFQIAREIDGLLEACYDNGEVVTLIACLVKEVAKYAIESNDEVQVVKAGLLTQAEINLRKVIELIYQHAEKKGMVVIPSPTALFMGKNWGTDVELMSTGACSVRYGQIDESLQRLYGEGWRATIPGSVENATSTTPEDGLPWGDIPAKKVVIPMGTVASNAVMASGQLHWKTSLRDHPNASNLSRALAGMMIANAAASPLLPDKNGKVRETGCASARNAFWLGNVGCTDVFGWNEEECVVRFGYGDWLDEEDPYAVLDAWKRDVEGRRPIVVDVSDNQSLSSPHPALALWIGTNWMLAVRDVPGYSAGRAHMRLENRMFPICCPADMMANTLMWLGGVEGLSGTDRTPASEICTYREARENFVQGVHHGSRAIFTLHGEKISYRDYWERTLYPAILRGAGLMGFIDGEVRKFGGILESRLKCPPELAMRLLWRHATSRSSSERQALTYVGDFLSEKHLANVPFSIWGLELLSKNRTPLEV